MIHSRPTDMVARLQSRLKRLRRDTSYTLGFNPSIINAAKGARILVYHGLCLDDPFRYNTLFITQKTFEAQLRLYKKYFNIVSLDEFYEQRFRRGKFSICLTFDDGFANNYKYVLPLLEEYKVPATFFITSIRDAGYDILWNDVLAMAAKHGPSEFIFGDEGFVRGDGGKNFSPEKKQSLTEILKSTGFESKAAMIKTLGSFRHKANEDYWLQMTDDQIRLLASCKWVTIGSHSYYHNDLTKIDASLLKEDLKGSKHYLQNITGKEIKSLAFPYGSYSTAVVEEAKDAGYSQLLATGYLSSEDEKESILKERLTINPFISPLNQLYASIAGNY